MADFGKIYSDAIAIEGDPEVLVNQAEQEAREQLHLQTKIDWLKNIRTQEIFDMLNAQILELENDARQLAVSFHSHNNYQQIIKKLIEASTLRDFINTYGHA